MRIVIGGGTGFIGKALSQALLKRGDQVAVLTRSSAPPKAADSRIQYVQWNPADETSFVREIDGSEAVINLAGDPIVGKRWSERQKRSILESRVHSTQKLVHSITKVSQKPQVLINASAVGFYGPRGSESLSEDSRAGEGFLTEVCKAWETHAVRAEDFDVRVVRLRTGVVLDKSGGALSMMLPAFKMGLGGWLGHGNQWMSWIALEDLIRLILFCLDQPNAKGAVNAVAPQPVTNKAFSIVLAQVLRRPCLMPVPALVLKWMLGEASEVLLTGQRVIPKKAEELGFSFRYFDIRRALEAILR